METITSEQREQLKIGLLSSGLELMDDKKAMLIEKIKNVIVQMVHHSEEVIKVNFSDFLSEKQERICIGVVSGKQVWAAEDSSPPG